VPANPHDLYKRFGNFPGAEAHGSTWAPARFSAEQSQTVFIVDEVIDYLKRNADEPFFVHASFITTSSTPSEPTRLPRPL